MTRRGVFVSLGALGLVGAGLIGIRSSRPAAPVSPASPAIPPIDALVSRMEAGDPIVLDGSARPTLELAGFRFRSSGTDAVVTGRYRCATLYTDRWSLLAGVEYTGRLGVEVPQGAGGSVVIIVGDDLPLRLRASSPDGDPLALVVEPLGNGIGAEHPPPDYWMDGGNPLTAPPEAARVIVPAAASGSRLLGLDLGRRAPRVLARLLGYDGDPRGRVCAAPLGADEWFADGAPLVADVPLDDERLLGAGWHEVMADEDSWTGSRATAAHAAVLVPIASSAPTVVTLTAAPAAGRAHMLGLEVNGVPQPARAMAAGGGIYSWTVPQSAWLPGSNELLFSLSPAGAPVTRTGGDVESQGMLVRSLRLSRER